MDIRNLNCFIAVAQYLNFTEAAKHLYIAQSAVSRNIAELEKELNVKLFNRNRRSISLTSSGEYLLKEAFKITSLLREATAGTQKRASGAIGRLSVGFVFEPIIDCMLSCFKSFYKNYPDIDVHYNSYDSITMSRLLDTKELDIGFARLITINNRETKYWQPIYCDPLYICVPVSHRLANEPVVSMKMIENETLILMSREVNPGMYDSALHLYMNNGITPIIIDHANDLLTTIMMAQIGIGLVILPGRFARLAPPDLRFIRIDNEAAYHEIGVVWHKENINPAVELFLEEMGIQKQYIYPMESITQSGT